MFSPVTRYLTVKFFLALSAMFSCKRCFLEVKNALVNALLKEKIYVEQPESFVAEGMENHVLLLK